MYLQSVRVPHIYQKDCKAQPYKTKRKKTICKSISSTGCKGNSIALLKRNEGLCLDRAFCILFNQVTMLLVVNTLQEWLNYFRRGHQIPVCIMPGTTTGLIVTTNHLNHRCKLLLLLPDAVLLSMLI